MSKPRTIRIVTLQSSKDRMLLAAVLLAEVSFRFGASQLSTPAVLAYIDPGLGVMLVQAIIAAFFGAIFYFRTLRQAIGRFFGRVFKKRAVQASASAAEKK